MSLKIEKENKFFDHIWMNHSNSNVGVLNLIALA